MLVQTKRIGPAPASGVKASCWFVPNGMAELHPIALLAMLSVERQV
jgi:hypothetical protein